MNTRLIDSKSTRELLPPMAAGMNSRFNPSICFHNGKFYISVRESSYTLYGDTSGSRTVFSGPKKYISEVFLCSCDNPMVDELEFIQMTQVPPLYKDPYFPYKGIEDIRLVSWNNELWYSGTRRDWNKEAGGKVEEGVIEKDKMDYPSMLLPRQRIEKNYMPIEDRPHEYIYQIWPTLVLKGNFMDEIEYKCKSKAPIEAMRGSSQAVRYKDGYLFIAHTRTKQEGYWHYFVRMDEFFRVVAVSEPFRFDNSFVEFCCGLCIHDNKVYITYGVMDNRAFVLEMDIREIDKIIFEKL